MIDGATPTPTDGAAEDVAEQLERFAVLGVGGLRLGVEGRHCSGLIEAPRPTRLPRSADFVLGVLYLRGTIIPLLDTGRLLGIERGGPYAAGLVISSSAGTGVLATNEMVDFGSYDVGRLGGVNDQVPPRLKSFARGVLMVGGARIVVVDVVSVFKVVRRPSAAGEAGPSL